VMQHFTKEMEQAPIHYWTIARSIMSLSQKEKGVSLMLMVGFLYDKYCVMWGYLDQSRSQKTPEENSCFGQVDLRKAGDPVSLWPSGKIATTLLHK